MQLHKLKAKYSRRSAILRLFNKLSAKEQADYIVKAYSLLFDYDIE